jgi:hypothetical protein
MSAKAGWLMNDLFGGDVIVASLTKMGYNLTSIKKRRKQTCLHQKEKIIQLKISTHFLMDSVRSFLMEKSI